MDREKYLKRINFTNKIIIDAETLIRLHEYHVYNIPFENLDIHYKQIFDLEFENLYRKVVVNFRGGFCYELNSLFYTLLCDIGFKCRIISSRIFDDFGNLGPDYDHMSICVEANKKYLADVGFGDLFIRPLEIKDGIQSDGRNLFKIEKYSDQDFLLSMSPDQKNFHKKYTFSLDEVSISKFHDICLDKQTNPMSYFVKNTVCTKPTQDGRVTLFNNKLIEKKGDQRLENLIGDNDELREVLRSRFGVLVR